MEIVCRYDEYGNYLGPVERETAQQNGWWKKGCSVAIINSNNQILLSKRAEGRRNAEAWELCSGHVRDGEHSSETITREMKEELGLERINKLIPLRQNMKTDPSKEHLFVDVYMLEQDVDINTVKVQKEEVSEVRWMNLSEVKELSLGPYKLNQEELESLLKAIEQERNKNVER